MTTHRLVDPLPWHAGRTFPTLTEPDPPADCRCSLYPDLSVSRRDPECPVHTGRTQR